MLVGNPTNLNLLQNWQTKLMKHLANRKYERHACKHWHDYWNFYNNIDAFEFGAYLIYIIQSFLCDLNIWTEYWFRQFSSITVWSNIWWQFTSVWDALEAFCDFTKQNNHFQFYGQFEVRVILPRDSLRISHTCNLQPELLNLYGWITLPLNILCK